MAMEKLILRSVMYGADKIPDSWFEKLPGGYFRQKEENRRNSGQYGQYGSNNSGGYNGPSGDHRRSNAYYGARPYEDNPNQDDGYRSEGHRRRQRRSRSSYDGGADDDYYKSGDDRHRPRRAKSHRRRRSADNDRYGYDDGHRRRDDQYDDRRRDERRRYPDDPDYGGSRPSTRGGERSSRPVSSGAFAAPAGVAGAAFAAGAAPYPRSSVAPSPVVQSPQFAQPQQAQRGSVGNGYVPYSEIYSQQSSDASVRPNDRYMVTPVTSPLMQGYQQNSFAQQYPTAADAGAGMQYNGQPGFINQNRAYNDGYDPRYSQKRYNGYDENDEPNSGSPSPHRRSSRRDYSPSHDRDDSRESNRRARSERRKNDKSQDQGRSKSRIKEAFDASERGLGYGAVGAVTGGMLGSEFGKGIMPKAIGATLGALGANAFEARERYEDPRTPPYSQMHTQPSPPTNRRKDYRRPSEAERESAYERRDGRRRRDEGYHSD